MNRQNLLITLDSMKNSNTGLYYFSRSLGLALYKAINIYTSTIDLTFYVHGKSKGMFKHNANIIKYNKLHNLYFPYNNRYDLVHFTDQICRLPVSKVNAKKIVTIHDLNYLYESNYSQKEISNHQKKLRTIINQCDKIVAISNFVANDIKQHFPESYKKIQVIYNGVDKMAQNLQHLPQYKPNSSFIFTIGELLPKKNFHVLPSLLQNNNFELVIAGQIKDQDYFAKIENEAAKYCGRVTILGAIGEKDKAWYYSNCNAFVFPSLAEGFGLPVIEAMQFGKPVFLSTKTALPEIGGNCAYYFENFDAEHMSLVFKNGMSHYNNNPSFKDNIIDRAKVFTWEKAAKQYLNLYQNLLQ